MLAPLIEAGFLSFDSLGESSATLADLAGAGPRVLVVTGARAEAGPDAAVPALAAATVNAGLVTVLAGRPRHRAGGTGRGARRCWRRWRASPDLVSVVDNADRTEGQVGAVLALAASTPDAAGGAHRVRRGRRRGSPPVDPDVTPAPEGAGSSVTRSVAGMGAAAALSRSFGGLRMVVIAAVLGTTYLGNTFQAANSVSNVLFELLAAGALSAVLVPTFVAHFSRREDRRVEEVAGGVLSIALAGSAS